MAVVVVTTLTVKPDRMEDYLDQVARPSKALLEKMGARNCRVLTGVVAGEATGSVVFICEADDFAAVGAVMDKLSADPEGVAMMSIGSSAAGPVAGLQTAFWVDIPL